MAACMTFSRASRVRAWTVRSPMVWTCWRPTRWGWNRVNRALNTAGGYCEPPSIRPNRPHHGPVGCRAATWGRVPRPSRRQTCRHCIAPLTSMVACAPPGAKAASSVTLGPPCRGVAWRARLLLDVAAAIGQGGVRLVHELQTGELFGLDCFEKGRPYGSLRGRCRVWQRGRSFFSPPTQYP